MPELACSWARRRRSSLRMLRDATTTIPPWASASDFVGVGARLRAFIESTEASETSWA